MVFGTDKKMGIIRDTSIQPFQPKEETFEIPIPKEVLYPIPAGGISAPAETSCPEGTGLTSDPFKDYIRSYLEGDRS